MATEIGNARLERIARLRITLGGLAAALVFSGVVVACSGGTAPEVSSGDPILEQGRDLYVRNCAGCHGLSGGGATGPQLSEGAADAKYPDIEDQVDVVINGRDRMPAFGGRLSQEEVEAVVRYTREVL